MAKLSGQFCAVLFHGYDISGRTRSFDGMGVEYTELDHTAFLDGVMGSEAGMPLLDASVESFFDPQPDATPGPETSVWKALREPGNNTIEKLLSVLIGQGASPVPGDPSLAVASRQFKVTVPAQPNAKMLIQANFKTVGQKPDLGQVLGYTTITNTLTGTTVDTAVGPYAAGGTGYLHVLKATTEDTPGTDTYSIKIQHSPNGTAWADYITFAANGATRTSERIKQTTSLDRYWRCLLTRTGAAADELTFAIMLAAN